MPRNVKESDDEMEPKSGRKTRAALNPSVLDSPLRRSTRIKQPVQQEGSSPESVSDVSSVGTTRSTRRRTTTGDSSVVEPARNLRTRRNSIASDISELTETESLPERPGKRVTRRSVAGVPTADTPTKLNGRARRTTRAGSESKSSPPVGRITRRSRASSLEPEGTEDAKIREVRTPVKSRRRASALPSEPDVAEESEDSIRRGRRTVNKTVYEIEEDESDSPLHNTTIDPNEFVEKMEIDESPVRESEGNRIERSTQENTEAGADISHAPKKLEDSIEVADSSEAMKADDGSPQRISSPLKGSSYTIESLLSPATEKQEKSPGNKENEILNDSAALLERSVNLSTIDVRLMNRKSLNSVYVKPQEKRHNISLDDGLLSNYYETPTKSQEDVNTGLAKNSTATLNRKERYSVEDCVVIIEPMEIDRVDKIVTAKASSTSETPKTRKTDLVVGLKSYATGNEEIDCKLSRKEVENTENVVINKDIADGEADLKISNVVSVAADEEDEKRKEEQEVMEDFEPTEALHLVTISASDAIEEGKLSESVNDETVPQKRSSLNVVRPASNSDEKTPSDGVNDEKASTEPSSSDVETIISSSSINNAKPINSEEIEDNLVFAKGKKSSIVTESPTSGVNGEEALNVSEEEKRRRSVSNGRSSDAGKEKNTSDEIEDKSLEKEIEEERKALQSDEESEYECYPEFIDIPADEWTGADFEESKKVTEIETNSLHSVSTERNESECDFELVDKEVAQSAKAEKEGEVRSDYDSDDTVKIAIATRKSEKREDEEKKEEELVASHEMTIDPSSDSEKEEDIETTANKDIYKKRASLDTSRKINEAITPLANKNISLVAHTSVTVSPVSLNVSRPKSLLCVDDQSNDGSNFSMKLNDSSNKSLKKCSLNSSARSVENAESDNEPETDNAEAWTPKMINRKSLDASGKKLEDRTLDSSKTIVSAKNTPLNVEKRASETSAKRNRTLNQSALSLQSDSGEDSGGVALKKDLRRRSSKICTSAASSSTNYALASPKVDTERLNRSAEIRSARKSLNEKNSSKIPDASSDSDIEVGESQGDPSSPELQLNKSGKSSNDSEINGYQDSPASPEAEEEILEKSIKFGSAKKSVSENNSTIPLASSDSEAEFEASQESPASPEAEEKIFEQSVKFGSAKKSANINNSKIPLVSSDFEIEFETYQESPASPETEEEILEKSVKFGSGKKSIIDKNYSTIVQINSDSDVNEDMKSDNSDDADVSRKIPRFLFDRSSSSSDNDEDDDSSRSIDCDVARELNLDGKSVLEYSDDDVPADDCMATESESSDNNDDGADLIDFVVDDDEDDESESDVATDLVVEDDEPNESSSSEEERTPRKRIIPRPARSSDSDESDEVEPMNVSSTFDKSKTAKTPTKPSILKKTLDIVEPDVKSVNPNLSAKSSTPKTLGRQSFLFGNLNSSKATTPLNKSLKSPDSSAKLEVSSTKRLSKSACEPIDTPTKLGSSFKLAKTSKTPPSVQKQLQTSLPVDLPDSTGKTNLSKDKSTKLMMLNQTVILSGSESPETRFLMKEKLNDSLPALKFQQRDTALRRSVLDKLRAEAHAMNEVPEEIDEIQKKIVKKRVSLGKEDAVIEPEVSSEKKKKKKKKKKRESSNASENPEEEFATSFTESATEVVEGRDSLIASSKKSKKLNKKKKTAETPEREETKVEEIPKKKKKKKQEECIEQVESDEALEKDKKKKKKNRTSVELTEPEVPTLRQKSRRIAARNVKTSGSASAPEAIDFPEVVDAVLRDYRKVSKSTKAGQEVKKKKHQEHLSPRQERKTKSLPEAAGKFEIIKTSVKRLSDDVLANLSDVAERPKKRRKVVKEEKMVSSTTMFSPPANFIVDDGYIPLSSSGGTTQFGVVNLKKASKHSKKAVAAVNFRERMLARNPRQPISAYLMYQQKQKASGKSRLN